MISPLVLLVVTIVIYVIPFDRAILDDGDALYTHIAQQMVQRGDWVTPMANGVRFLDKPPLAFWAMAASFKLFGVSERTARRPLALAILATSLLLLLLVRRVASEFAGLTAGLAFLLSTGTLFFTFEAFPDIYLVLFLTLAVFALIEGMRDSRHQFWAIPLFFVAIALATLAKGLIGILFPVAIVVLFFLITRERPAISGKYALIGLCLFALIALPWHFLAASRNPGFLHHYFVNEQLLRFIGRRQPVDYGSIPIPLFWLLVVVWSFPWSAFLPAFPGSLFKGPTRTVVIAALSWIAVVMGFFTFSSRLEHYSFPALPPIAILSALALTSLELSRRVARCFAFLAGIGAGCAAAVIVLLAWMPDARPVSTSIATTSRDRAYTNLFSPLFELPDAIQAALRIPLLLALSVIAVGLLTAWWFNRRERRRASVRILAVMMLCFSIIAVRSLKICEPLLSSKQFGLAISRTAHDGEQVIVVGDFESANSINFYAPQARTLVYRGRAPSIEAGLAFRDAPKLIIDSKQVAEIWGSSERAYLLGSAVDVRDSHLSPQFVIMEKGGRLLVSNKAN